jgi:hypothetical protein
MPVGSIYVVGLLIACEERGVELFSSEGKVTDGSFTSPVLGSDGRALIITINEKKKYGNTQ